MKLTIMENQYINYYKKHSENELIEVINSPNSYNNEARLAAYELLGNKEYAFSSVQTTEYEDLKNEFKQKDIDQQAKVEAELSQELPSWYSPTAILGFSIFLEPLFGAILLSHNFKIANKTKQAKLVILVGVLFLLARMALIYTQQMSQIASLAISIGAGIVFVEVFWKKHLGYQVKYERKSIWKPLLIFVGITLCLFGLQMYLDPELYQQLLKQQQMQFAK